MRELTPETITDAVLDQMATSRAYSDQTTGRLIEPSTLAAAVSRQAPGTDEPRYSAHP